MASVEPGASAAVWRRVAAIASFVRYMLTPVEATIAGWPASKPSAVSRSPHQILEEAGPAEEGGGEEARALGALVGAMAPVFVGGRQLQAVLVLENMGRGIALEMRGAP